MNLPESKYLGDSVYVGNDGYHVVLTTGHHVPVHASNIIMLDPEVANELRETLNKMHNDESPSK